MLVSVRPELHERFPHEGIPSSDYQIEAEEFAEVGAYKEWPDKSGMLKALPSALYIGTDLTRDDCERVLSAVSRRTGRRVSATMHAGDDIFFFALKDASLEVLPASDSWLRAALAAELEIDGWANAVMGSLSNR